jgi:hypothetical protein
MQALVCTQDWLYGKPFSLLSNEDLEKLKQGKTMRCLYWICYYL